MMVRVRSTSFKTLLKRASNGSPRATELHVFDVRYGQTNIGLIGIRRNHEGWNLEVVMVPIARRERILLALKEALEQERLLRVEVVQITETRAITISKLEPGIPIEQFVELVDRGEILSNSNLVWHGNFRLVEINNRRYAVVHVNEVPALVRMFPSSFWLALLDEDFRTNGTSEWEGILIISPTTMAVTNLGIQAVTVDELIRYANNPQAFNLYSALPLQTIETGETGESGEATEIVEETSEGQGNQTDEDEALAQQLKKIMETALEDDEDEG